MKDLIYFNDEWNGQDEKPNPAHYDDMKIYLKDLDDYNNKKGGNTKSKD